MFQFLLLLRQEVGVVRSISRGECPNGVQRVSNGMSSLLTRVEDRTRLFTLRCWDVNLKGVLSDLPFDLERSRRLRCQRHNAAKLVPMVLTLVDHDVLSNFELVIRLLAIAHLFGPRLFKVQRA